MTMYMFGFHYFTFGKGKQELFGQKISWSIWSY